MAADNGMTSTFKSLKTLPFTLVVAYKTNKKPEENRLFMINEKQDTVYQRNPQQCKPDMLYTDTIHLKPGLYEFELTDKGAMALNSGLNLNMGTATCVSSIQKVIFCITSSAIAETDNS